MISPVVLTASEALCLCVPYLGEAKRLAVTANQSGGGEKGARVFLYAGSQLGMNQRVEKEAKGRMTERLDTQAAPWRHRNKCRICKSEEKKEEEEEAAAARRKSNKVEQAAFNWPNSNRSKEGATPPVPPASFARQYGK